MDVRQLFADFVTKHHLEALLEILAALDPLQHYSVTVNIVSLYEENVDLGDSILANAEATLPLFDEGLIIAQKNILESPDNDRKSRRSLKTQVHARIQGGPSSDVSNPTGFPRNEELGAFLTVTGTVVKVTLPKLLEYKRVYRCTKCALSQSVAADFHLSHALKPPTTCPSNCIPAFFTPVKAESDGSSYKDYQEIKVQEELGKIRVGTIPSSIWITLDNDLVDTCHPGDHVTVWGTALRRWRSLHAQEKSDVELVVKGNSVAVTNDQKSASLVTDEARAFFAKFWEDHKAQPLVGRDLILASFCPEVYGLYLVKLAMCVVLAGGVARVEEGGSFVRAESHLLLVGDPGTAKSHLLRFAAKTAARAVLTTGVGSTSAGLTVSAVREGSDWQLEAGALVLADGGVCCIDELNSIREQDRTSIHEAMEQQTISVAKAGMVTKLNTRCAILAATNSKGQYDPSESMCVNVALASPLLSRFDLILVLQDTRSQDWDRLLSGFILELSSPSVDPSQELWTLKSLQSYFAVVKTYRPVMTRAANLVLSRYYQTQRNGDARNAARTTVRMLESLIRLSQGHARLMMHTTVTLTDAVVAVTLVECSMAASALISATNALHAAFPTDPQEQLRRQAELILVKLGLTDLLAEESAQLNGDCPLGQLPVNHKMGAATTTSSLIHPKEKVQEPLPDFPQCLTSILSEIRKKKTRPAEDAADVALKRKRESAGVKMRKRQGIGCSRDSDSSDSGEGNEAVSENRRCSSGSGCPLQLNRLESGVGGCTGLNKAVDEDLFSDMRVYEFGNNTTVAGDSHGLMRADYDVDNGQNNSSCPELDEIIREKGSSGTREKKLHCDDANKNQGKGIKKVETHGRCIQPTKSIVEKLSAFKFAKGLPKVSSSEMVQVDGNERNKGKEFICDKFVISSTPLPEGPRFVQDSLLVPSPLLTNEGRPGERHFDCDKLKALAMLGKALSQSQSSSLRINSQVPVVKEPSEFVLNDMSWDDLSVDL